MVLENINLSENKIGRPPLWYKEKELGSVISRLYTLSEVYIPTIR
jgi:hypothetical protein